MKTLNVLGAGRVGRTLALLLKDAGAFAVQDVLDCTRDGAQAAVRFIGAGDPVDVSGEARAADVWMITTPDREIVAAAARLVNSGKLRPGDVVFHCSGSMASSELAAVGVASGCVGSVHPLKTFAEPNEAARSFSGTHCAAEGGGEALDVLVPAFERIGGRVATINPQLKVLYHAASVIVCNCLTALMEAGLRCYEKTGLERETAARMMAPIVRETLDNVLRLGTAAALTGPVARGDDAVVARHLEALDAFDVRIAAIYRELSIIALDLSRERGEAEAAALMRLDALLNPPYSRTP